MQLRGIRFWLVIAVCTFTLALLLGGRWFYQQRFVETNLVRELRNVPGVETVNVIEKKDYIQIRLGLGKVWDLQKTYVKIRETVSEVYDLSGVRIDIVNKPDPDLEAVWARAQFAVYQALIQGNFTEMAEVIDRQTGQAGVANSKVQMDWDNVYLQLQQGDNYSYYVIPRVGENRTATTTSGKGSGGV